MGVGEYLRVLIIFAVLVFHGSSGENKYEEMCLGSPTCTEELLVLVLCGKLWFPSKVSNVVG